MADTCKDNLLLLDAERLKARLNDLVTRGRAQQAFHLLDRLDCGQSQVNLFGPTLSAPSVWLHRVDLLRTLGRCREALAWACLACDQDPGDQQAVTVREELKKMMSLQSKPHPIPLLTPDELREAEEEPDPDDLWRGVAGMHDLKAVLERDVVLPMKKPWLYRRYKVTVPNGVLLHGPPGCGKTFIARKLGERLGFRFFEISPSDLGSTYVHGTQGKIRRLFDLARRRAPSLVFLDELDALLPKRDGAGSHHYAAEVNEMLVQLNRAADDRVLVIGATNRLHKLDAAAVRPGRFDKKILVGPPDLEARRELLRLYLFRRPKETLDLERLAGECADCSCADIEHVVNEAARRAMMGGRRIQEGDLMAALAGTTTAETE